MWLDFVNASKVYLAQYCPFDYCISGEKIITFQSDPSAQCAFNRAGSHGITDLLCCHKHIYCGDSMLIPYPRERGPMGGAPYIGPRLGDGPIFEVSVACLNTKERPGKLPTLSS